MSFEQFLFYTFAFLLMGSAMGVVVARNTIYSALLLIVAFFNSAALWLLLYAEFLAITLILVYVGAVMVLFLFVIMMLDLKSASFQTSFARYLPLGLGLLFILVVELLLMLQHPMFERSPVSPVIAVDNTTELGKLLYTNYLYPFEIAAVILLVAIIAAIILTLRRRDDVKTQQIEEQVQVRREDRVRLVKMPSGRQL